MADQSPHWPRTKLADSLNSPEFAADDEGRARRNASSACQNCVCLPAQWAVLQTKALDCPGRITPTNAFASVPSDAYSGPTQFFQGIVAMMIRLLAVAALLVSTGTSLTIAQEGQIGQQCNCPKCQAARKAHEESLATYNAMPAGLFAAPVAPNTTVTAAPEVQQAGHHYYSPGPMPPMNQSGPCQSWAAGPANGYGSGYNYGHPGRIHTGGNYGPYGGAHGTPGYPRHMHMHREYVGPQGPPSAAVAYPYYTTRGPRDFLMDNPPSIGR